AAGRGRGRPGLREGDGGRRRAARRAGGVSDMAKSTVTAALRAIDAQFADTKQTLVDVARIPGVSAAGFPANEVRRSAQAFADLLGRTGLDNVQVLEIPGVHPYVYADWMQRPGAPTLVLYGHHDVAPPARLARWVVTPF